MRTLFISAAIAFSQPLWAQSVDSTAVLEKTPLLQFWNKSPNCAKDTKITYRSPQVGNVKDLADTMSSLDGVVLFVGDGNHGNADHEYLLTHLISRLVASGKSVRVYAESVNLADESGFARITPDYYLRSETEKKAQWNKVGARTVNPEAEDNLRRFLAKMQGQGMLSAFAVDRGEGSPFHDGDVAWMSLDAQNRFLNAKKGYFKKFGTRKQPEQIVLNHYQRYAQSAEELSKFVAASELYRSYMKTKTWLPDLQVSLEKRNKQDEKVAARIAADINANPEAIAIVIYGVRHYRNADDSLDAQVAAKLPESRPRTIWSMYPTVDLLVDTECAISMSTGDNGTFVSIVSPGSVPKIPLRLRDLFIPGALNSASP